MHQRQTVLLTLHAVITWALQKKVQACLCDAWPLNVHAMQMGAMASFNIGKRYDDAGSSWVIASELAMVGTMG